jgi:hypothetical protein
MTSLPAFLQSGMFNVDPNNMDPRMRDEIAELILDRLGSSQTADELSPQYVVRIHEPLGAKVWHPKRNTRTC